MPIDLPPGLRWAAAIGAAFAMAAVAGSAHAAPTWGVGMPTTFGAGVQNANPNAVLSSISCAGAGDCTAAGRFRNAAGGYEAFTQTMANGTWAEATPALFAGGVQRTPPDASFAAVSCATANSCSAVGRFSPTTGVEAFAQARTGGVWGTAAPATFAGGAQHTTPDTKLTSVSCPSAGVCVAGGRVRTAAVEYRAFTQTLSGGTWSDGALATFAAGVEFGNPASQFVALSCASVGECVGVGFFLNAGGGYEAFSQTMTNGTWGTATPAAFAAGVQSNPTSAEFQAVSCATAGNCTAAGSFQDAAGHFRAFTQTMTNGTWATAVPVTFAAGVENPNVSQSSLGSISCGAPGNCTAVGQFQSSAPGFRAFAQTMTNGVWGDGVPAEFAPGVAVTGAEAILTAVSCSGAGRCTAVGRFPNAAGHIQAFTQTLRNGTWTQATPVVFAAGRQSATPNASLDAVSCTSAGNCTAAGRFLNASGHNEAFTVTSTQAPGDDDPAGDSGDTARDPAPVPGAQAAAATASTASTPSVRGPATPRVRWSARVVRPGQRLVGRFAVARDATYTITASRRAKDQTTIRGTCRIRLTAKTRVRTGICTIRLTKAGVWRVAITPRVTEARGMPASTRVRVRPTA